MPTPFPRPPKLIVFTGPGLAREAGFAPFDPATMPPGVAIEDVVTREGFSRDPAQVHDFYNRRRRELRAATPSPAHAGLAALDLTRPGDGATKALRIRRPSSPRTGMFCKFGLIDDSRPVAVAV